MSEIPEPSVIAVRQGRIGRITLNRPKALNALDLSMVLAISDALHAWRDDPAVHAVVIEGAGGRAFCAGGDIRQIRGLSVAHDFQAIERFFVAEYALNLAISQFPKPYIALIDGICMGGGIGLSIHGGIRVASDAATFAMPETAIGLFPDVGATHALPRLRGHWGMYLALTGARVGGADAAWLGIATHYVPHHAIGGLADAIAADGPAALIDVTEPPSAPSLPAGADAMFSLDSVDEIVRALEADGSAFARDALHALRHLSPTAILWTFEIVRRGARLTLEHALQAELALTRHAVRHPDFIEGVRAMVIDKDRTPSWSPDRLENVDRDAIGRLFTEA